MFWHGVARTLAIVALALALAEGGAFVALALTLGAGGAIVARLGVRGRVCVCELCERAGGVVRPREPGHLRGACTPTRAGPA